MYFVGMNPENNVPLANGQVLVWLSQYDGYRPVDRVVQAFYPDYDLSSSVLSDDGIMVLVDDGNERIWYDPHGLIREQSGQLGEVVSVDYTRFLEGMGAYEVISHKGNTLVKSTTWVPPGVSGFVRRYEVSTVKGNASDAWIYPIIHLKNASRHVSQVYISRISELRWMAVTATNALDTAAGNLSDILRNRRFTSAQHGSIPSHVTFRSHVEIPEGCFSHPVHLIVAFGRSREAALQELERIRSSEDCLLEQTMRWWGSWHSKGAQIKTADKTLDYLWKTSLTLIRMSLQKNGSPVLIGFQPYQGNVWIRDAVWVASTLAMTGHVADAMKVLSKLRSLLQKRPDGGFYFSYNCSMEDFTDHTYENDSMGILLYGFSSVFRASGDEGFIENNLDLLKYSAEWILSNIDETGLMRPCAGISEVFGPHLDRDHEHMTWTSGISALGLREMANMLDGLNHEGGDRHRKAADSLVKNILDKNTKGGILRRSLESDGLDASALLFYTQFPVFPEGHPVLKATAQAITESLSDPFLGGVWRYDELVTEEGDLKPWIFYTLALGEAYLYLGNEAQSWNYLEQALMYASYCGLLPELVYTHDLVRGVAMPSLSQCGLLRYLLAWVDWEKGTFRARPPIAFSFMGLPTGNGRVDVKTEPRDTSGNGEGSLG